MSTIKEYSLTNDVKKKLGMIININRTMKQKAYTGLIETNPYTKENFSKDICHYHTLTKLENEVVKDDFLYHLFLEKLGFYFQIEDESHYLNMMILEQLTTKLLYTNEYLDERILEEINKDINELDFSNDCIADIHLHLIKYTCKLQKFISSDEEISFVEAYIQFFEDVYSGLAYHYLGVSYLKKKLISKAEEYLNLSKKKYEQLNIGKGIVKPNLINVHEYKYEYLNAVNICNEMERYYVETNNTKRLIHIYNFMSYFYLMINDFINGKKYYDKCMEIIDGDENLLRYKDIVQYNFGVYIIKNFSLEQSIEYLIPSYKICQLKDFQLRRKNVVLLVMTSLKYSENDIKEIIYDGIEESNDEFQVNMFKYYKYKYEKPGYHRKFALEKLIPYLKERNNCEELLFLYEELYG